MYADHERPGAIARLLCRIFGHTFSPRDYFRAGRRSVTDGIGRLHINVEGTCERCERMVEFGQLHVPNGPWEFDHRTRRYWQKVVVPESSMASWDAEHPHPVTIKEVTDATARRMTGHAPSLPPDVSPPRPDIDDDMADRRVRFERVDHRRFDRHDDSEH